MAHDEIPMPRVAARSFSPVILALIGAAIVVGCVPSMPRFWSSEPAETTAPSEVTTSTGQAIGDGGAAQVELDPLADPGAARPSGNEITVPSGKTLYAIARDHDVAVRDLIVLNQLEPPYRLLAGQTLKLPTERTYLVQRGDTLYGVARRLGVDLHMLVQRNNLPPPYKVLVGMRLKLPSPREPLGEIAEPAIPRPTQVASVVVLPPPPPPRPDILLAENTAEPLSIKKVAAVSPAAGPRSARLIAPPARAGARFFWPVKGKVVSQFGRQGGGVQHDGIAIAVPRGTPVKASENGVVAYAGSDLKAYGNLLLIRHANGWMTAYAHNETLLVREGDVVKRGQVIARAGASGNAKASQAYFEIRHQGKPVDPLAHLSKG
ncbi:MAG: LysM peptidoglycan-binding domain-containing protein [Alphaproteobacteria bacterium]|nr:LysM peptidoglycan-binding domain-containing protein [Alphaproteobacteria bacterium]